MTNIWKFLTAAAVVALCTVVPAGAQLCDDFDECTNPDMCADGECAGTPVSGGSCDDNRECTDPDTCAAGVCTGAPLNGGACNDANACTTNDTCVSGQCQGTPVQNGTACGVGANTECGICMQGMCVPDIEKQGMPCSDVLGACTEDDVCIGTICLGTFIDCEDLDENKCTAEVCNPFMGGGMCGVAGPVPCGNCSTCDDETGGCVPANEGLECDDANVCNDTGTCQTGSCVLGILGGTFTPTGTPVGTATATITATPTGPTGIPTATDTPILTPISTATGTPTGTVSPTVPATGTPTGTVSATFTATGTPTGTVSATVTATVTNTTVPTSTATATPPGPSNTPTVTRTGTVTTTPLPIVATIIVGSATGVPGGTVSFSVRLDTTAEVSGTQNDITFDADARIPTDDEGDPRCTVNPAIDKPDTAFAFLPTDCTPGTTCTGIRAVVISLDDLEAIPTGSVLYTCDVVIAEDAIIGDLPLTCSNPGAGDPDAMRLGADCTNGAITVAAPGDATIVVDDIEGQPGDTVPLDVSLQTAVQVAGTENDITFAPQAPIGAAGGVPRCAVNPAINKDASTFAFLPTGCSVGSSCTGVHAEILSDSNDSAIPNGSTLYTCQVVIAEDAASGTYPLICSNPAAESPEGPPVNAICVNGEVVVLTAPTATVTPTPTTPTPPTATATVSQTSGSPTATSTVRPPTSTRTVSTPVTPPVTRTITPATPTRSATPRPSTEDDGCAIVAPEQTGGAWMLLVPVALLLNLRRRRR